MHSPFSMLIQLGLVVEWDLALRTSVLDFGMIALKVFKLLIHEPLPESFFATWNSTLQKQMPRAVLFELLQS
jgi:hypothetical protein